MSSQPPAASSPAMSDKPFGAACSAVPSSGKGSFSGMATDPVATAASNNPVLSTLVTAVKKAEQVQTRLEREQVRHCLETLTEVQRESVTLAYYGGYTYREVAELLDAALGTIKTRMRDGLIRLRGCLGVER